MVTESFWIYLILILVIFIMLLVIWIVVKQRNQRRYEERLKKLRKNAELRIIG